MYPDRGRDSARSGPPASAAWPGVGTRARNAPRRLPASSDAGLGGGTQRRHDRGHRGPRGDSLAGVRVEATVTVTGATALRPPPLPTTWDRRVIRAPIALGGQLRVSRSRCRGGDRGAVLGRSRSRGPRMTPASAIPRPQRGGSSRSTRRPSRGSRPSWGSGAVSGTGSGTAGKPAPQASAIVIRLMIRSGASRRGVTSRGGSQESKQA